jgi:tetratricopeptide (TPR) repeat protein
VSLLAGDPAAALESFRKGLALREAAGTSGADPFEYLSDLRFTHSRLGNACMQLADYTTARDHYRKALTAAEGLVAAGAPGGARQAAMCQEQLAMLSGLLGDLPAGLDYLRRCLAAHQALAAADPGNAEAQRDIYRMHALLGDFHHGSGDLAAARASYRESVARCERLARGDPDSVQKLNDYCLGCCKLANLEERAGDFAAAARSINSLLAFCQPHEAAGKPAAAAAKYWREAVTDNLLTYQAAAKLGLDDVRAIQAQQPPVRAGLLSLRARTLACRGQHREAAALATQLHHEYAQNAACLYFAARAFALCAAAVVPPAGSSSPDAQSLWRRYADDAVEVLRTYLQANPHLAFTVPTQPDFAGLRTYPAFQALLRPRPRPAASR